MLVFMIPTIINDSTPLTKVVPFEKCIRRLRLYFTNIEEVRNRLKNGELIETPYYQFKCIKSNSVAPKLLVTKEK